MLRPLRDFVCIKPIPYKHSFLYVAGILLGKGEVIGGGSWQKDAPQVALPWERIRNGWMR